MKNIPLTIENQDLISIIVEKENINTNDNQIKKMKSNLRIAINEFLTDRQKQILLMYYIDNKKMVDIAKELGVSKPYISKTIKISKNKLEKIKKFM